MSELVDFLTSRKTYAATIATISVSLPVWFGWQGMTPPERLTALQTLIISVSSIWGLHVAGSAYEDAHVGADPVSPPPAALPPVATPPHVAQADAPLAPQPQAPSVEAIVDELERRHLLPKPPTPLTPQPKG